MSEEKAIYSASTDIDVSKIIDDAMEKKDRTVTIFISNVGTTIKVTPTVDEDPRWIVRGNAGMLVEGYTCSECGRYSERAHSYCPHCGEKLKVPADEY